MTTLEFFLERMDRAIQEEMTVKLDSGVYNQDEYTRAIITHGDKCYTLDIVEGTITKCSCPDYHYRCRKQEKFSVCKHMIKASLELGLDL